MTPPLALRIKCCGCSRTTVLTLPIDDGDSLVRQLVAQHWSLSQVNWRSAERTQSAELREPLCPVCEEAGMRCPL